MRKHGFKKRKGMSELRGKNQKTDIQKGLVYPFDYSCGYFVIIAVAASGGEGSDSGNQPTSSNSGAVVNDSGNSNLGQSKVEIKSCKLTKDFEGNPAAVVTYSYTNNGKEAQAFDFAFITHAYQNGVEAEKCYVISDDGNYDSNNNQSKEIKPGVTIDVMVAYKLNDTTSPVEVEVGQFLSFDNTKITKTFNF